MELVQQNKMAKGKFITIEGGEGTGKTTQIKLLEIFLKKKKIKFITTREPGGSKGAEKIRVQIGYFQSSPRQLTL